MSERRNDTPPQPPTESHTEPDANPIPPHAYYEDDSTGYELYDPKTDDDTSDDAPDSDE